MPKKRKDFVELQKRVFAGWINEKLGESASRKVIDISKDLQDGVILIELIQKLSGKIIPEK